MSVGIWVLRLSSLGLEGAWYTVKKSVLINTQCAILKV